MSQELEDRFFNYAKQVRDFCACLDMNVINREYIGQLIRASGSVAANYIEASDSLGKNDERMKLRISRREAKESTLWLKLLLIKENELDMERLSLIDEASQIKKILSSIILKTG
jgi:four helix bundle protein